MVRFETNTIGYYFDEEGFKINVHKGINCLVVFTYNENHFMGFFNDKIHMKRCLGLTKGYDNLYKGTQWFLDPKSKLTATLLEYLYKAGIPVMTLKEELN